MSLDDLDELDDQVPARGAGADGAKGEPGEPDATIAHPASDSAEDRERTDTAPALPGEERRYTVLRSHSRGGLGEVFVARDEQLKRPVALKEIQARHASDLAARSRFLLEAEVTGGLEHPGIVPVYGLGCHADGRPFYSMRFIEGISFKEAIEKYHRATGPRREREFELRRLLRRFLDVCNAMEYAHSRGILHRDLKPANVMLGRFGETLVVDWGLAKRIGQTDTAVAATEPGEQPSVSGSSLETLPGSVVGTPAYMSPEQAAGQSGELGPASDIYSLGAMLYHLLANRPPFVEDQVSTLLARVREGRFPPIHQVARRVPRPLAAIAAKAMAREPNDRYTSCAALAEDIEAWLADEPVGALRDPLIQKLGRWIRRHRAATAAVGALLVTAVLGLGISNVWVRREEERTRRAKDQAEQNLAMADEAKKEAIAARQAAEEREAEAKRNQYLARLGVAQQAWRSGNVSQVLDLLDEMRPAPGEEDPRGFEYDWLLGSCYRNSATLRGHQAAVTDIQFSADGQRLFSTSHDTTVRSWNLASHSTWVVKQGWGEIYDCLSLSPDGKLLLVAEGTRLRLVEIETRREQGVIEAHTGAVTAVAFSRDGTQFVTASADRTVKLWKLGVFSVGQRARENRLWNVEDEAFAVAFAPDGKSFAAGFGARLALGPGAVRIWELDTGKPRGPLVGHQGAVYSLAYSPDGKRLATGSSDKSWRIWDLATSRTVVKNDAHLISVNSVAFSPDGKLLATGSADHTVAVWDAETGKRVKLFKAHTNAVSRVRFAPDGRQVASASGDGTIKLWDLAEQLEFAILDPPRQGVRGILSVLGIGEISLGKSSLVASIEVARDESLLAAASWDLPGPGRVDLWNLERRTRHRTIPGRPGSGVICCALSPDGRWLVVGEGGALPFAKLPETKRTVRRFDTATGKLLDEWESLTGNVGAVAIAPDGGSVAVGEQGRTTTLWDVKARRRITLERGNEQFNVTSIGFSTDGKLIATGGTDGLVRLHDADSLTHRGDLPHEQAVFAVAVSPDGKTLAVGTAGSPQERAYAAAEIALWDLGTRKRTRVLAGHLQGVRAVNWSADGKRLVSSSYDGISKLWEPQSGTEVLTFGERAVSAAARYLPDGKRIAIGAGHGRVEIWDSRLGDEARYAAAERQVAKSTLAGDWHAVLAGLDTLLAMKPANVMLRYQKARAYWELGQRETALALWQELPNVDAAPEAGDWIGSLWAEGARHQITQDYGRLAAALEVLIAVYQAGPLANTESTADLLWRLGNTQSWLLKDRDKGLDTYRQALSLQRKLRSAPRLPEVTGVMHNLAEVYYSEGNLEKAAAIHAETLEARLDLFANDPKMLAIQHHALARVLRDQDKPAEALEHMAKAVALCQKALPAGHPYRWFMEEDYAAVLRREGKESEAEALWTAIGDDKKSPGLEVPQFPVLQGSQTGGKVSGLAEEVIVKDKFVRTRRAPRVDALWGQGGPGPGLPVDNFSVRWTGWLRPPIAGEYKLAVMCDDSARVWIDRELVLDPWMARWLRRDESRLALTTEPLPIQVDYHERGGGAYISLRWTVPGTNEEIVIPESVFFLTREAAQAAKPSQSAAVPRGALKAELFRGGGLQIPLRTRWDRRIDQFWHFGPPADDMPSDQFSIRWTGKLKAPAPGRYRLILCSDDGARLWLDGRPLIDSWTPNNVRRNEVDVELSDAPADLKIEYFEYEHMAFASLRWARLDGSTASEEEVIPPEALLPPDPSTPEGQSAPAGPDGK